MSNEPKFTPGPWVANGRYIGTSKHMSAIAECRDINGNWSDDTKASANAHLIAAAPTLYEALEECLILLGHYEQKIDGEWGEGRNLAEIERDGELPDEILQARAALAEARGE